MVLRVYTGKALTIYAPTYQTKIDGTKEKFDATGKVLWVRQFEKNSLAPTPIPDSKVELVSDSDVSQLKYTGDKTGATWVKITLPGGESGFPVTRFTTVIVYAGRKEADVDADVKTEPVEIERITSGDEGLF